MKHIVFFLAVIGSSWCSNATAQKWIFEPTGGIGFNFPFENGLAIVQDGISELYGVMDTTGRLVMSYQFSDRPRFANGQAVIQKPITGADESESFLLESSGRIIKLSTQVDFSLGNHYFGRTVQPDYDADIEATSSYFIYKIAHPELLQSGGAITQLELEPAFGGQEFSDVHEFNHNLMLVEANPPYFIRPDGSTAFTWNKAEWFYEFDQLGYAYYMDADSVYLVNRNNQICQSVRRDPDRMKMFYYTSFGDDYFSLTQSFLEEWDTYLIKINSNPSSRFLGSQTDIFGLSKEGRYWEITLPRPPHETYTATLRTADGKEVKNWSGYQMDSVHGTVAALVSDKELLLIDFNGNEIFRTDCDYAWFAGEGYMWVSKGEKTGLLQFNKQ